MITHQLFDLEMDSSVGSTSSFYFFKLECDLVVDIVAANLCTQGKYEGNSKTLESTKPETRIVCIWTSSYVGKNKLLIFKPPYFQLCVA